MIPSTLERHRRRHALGHLVDRTGPPPSRHRVVLPAEHARARSSPSARSPALRLSTTCADAHRRASPRRARPAGCSCASRSSRCASPGRATGTGCATRNSPSAGLRHGATRATRSSTARPCPRVSRPAATAGSLDRSLALLIGCGSAFDGVGYATRADGARTAGGRSLARALLAAHAGDGRARAAGCPREVVEALVDGRILPDAACRPRSGAARATRRRSSRPCEELARARRRRGLVHRGLRDQRDGRRLHRRGRGAGVFGARRAVSGGVFAPRGTRVTDGDTYRGHRALGVRERHRPLRLADGRLHGDRERRRASMLAEGRPDIRLALFPAAEVEVIDTWNVSGLRGDRQPRHGGARARRARATRTTSLLTRAPLERGPLYAFPLFGLLALAIAGVALGIARAGDRRPGRAGGREDPHAERPPLAERPGDAGAVARAEAALRAARALLYEEIERGWDEAASRGEVTSSAGPRCGSPPPTPRPRPRRPRSTRPTTSAAAPRSTRPARSSGTSATCTPPRSTCWSARRRGS